MFKKWSVFKGYQKFRQIACLTGILLTGICIGQTAPFKTKKLTRLPASYVPDDDVIVKPENNEISLYQQYVASDQSSDVVKFRNQIKIWNDNEVFAQQYGLRTTLAGSPYFVPTEDEKWEYFKDKYLRYLRRRGEQPLKDMPKTWYQEYRASNEVDTIDELESNFKKSTKKSSSGSTLPKALQAKEVSIFKQVKFIFQPRLDQGLVIVGFKTPFGNARAWVGANGETEVNVQQQVASIGFRAMFNYYAHTGQYFTSMDQRIVSNVYARYTINNNPLADRKDDTVMLLYAKPF